VAAISPAIQLDKTCIQTEVEVALVAFAAAFSDATDAPTLRQANFIPQHLPSLTIFFYYYVNNKLMGAYLISIS